MSDLPASLRRDLERAIHDAEHPSGMSVHDGKAVIPADRLRYLLSAHDSLGVEIERLRGFIRGLFAEMDWPEGGDLDSFAFQELAEKHGLLTKIMVTEPCAETCFCASYNGMKDFDDGVMCYRKAIWLLDDTQL